MRGGSISELITLDTPYALAVVDDLRATLRELVTRDDGAAARDAIRCYFSAEGEGYTGSQFELVADSGHPNEITARDIVAVTMLSVTVPARPARWLVSTEGRAEVAALLEPVPTDLDIWEPAAAEHLAEGGHLWQLWDRLGTANWPDARQGNGLGTTTRSKLLAAKRPRLVPVYDSVVAKALPTKRIWRDFREMLLDGELRSVIEEATADAPDHVSLLRRIDIVVWMLCRDG